jgi:hypothetical protein
VPERGAAGQDRVVGVDLGGTTILAGVVDRDGGVERARERETPVESQEALLAGLDGPWRSCSTTGSPRSASGSRRGSTSGRGAPSAP